MGEIAAKEIVPINLEEELKEFLSKLCHACDCRQGST